MGAFRTMERSPADTLSIKAGLRLLAGLAVLVVSLLAVDWLLHEENLPVRAVRFEGPFQHVTRAELETAVMDLVRGNFLRLDLAAVQARVEQLPWVETASVRRVLPRDIAIRFTEERPVARWGETAYVNVNGEVIHLQGEGLPVTPRLDGPPGSARAVLERLQSFERLLAPAGLSVERLVLTARRSWRIVLKQGFALVLDRNEPERKLKRFARVYPAALAHVASRIQQVDLRYTNGFAVAWKGGVEANDN